MCEPIYTAIYTQSVCVSTNPSTWHMLVKGGCQVPHREKHACTGRENTMPCVTTYTHRLSFYQTCCNTFTSGISLLHLIH